MKFLKLMYDMDKAINKWLEKHPYKTCFYAISYVALTFFVFTRHIWWLSYLFMLGPMAEVLVTMVCSSIYLVKIGYKPPRCEKCGQVLPENMRHDEP